MSTLGHRIANLFGRGRTRPSDIFGSPSDAEIALLRERDEGLRALERAAVVSAAFSPDYSEESLRALDAWYLDLWQRDAFLEVGAGRAEFERWMAFYYGTVVVQNNADAAWVVEPAGRGRFQLAVRRGDATVGIDAFRDHYKSYMLNQRSRQSIYGQYRDEWK